MRGLFVFEGMPSKFLTVVKIECDGLHFLIGPG